MSATPVTQLGLEGAGKSRNAELIRKNTLDVYEQEFTAPGTWTWPGKCSFVEVLVVGGGGGGGAVVPSANPQPPVANREQSFHCAGGGGVGVFSVPVSAPVPVTVGAGGAGGFCPAANQNPDAEQRGQPGGISGFGPTASPFPPSAAVVGGGYGPNIVPALPIREIMGGGASQLSGGPTPEDRYAGGRYGYPGGQDAPTPTSYRFGGGAGGNSFYITNSGKHSGAGSHRFNYGRGSDGSETGRGGFDTGSRQSYYYFRAPVVPGVDPRAFLTAQNGRANSGNAGGCGVYMPDSLLPLPVITPLYQGADGGSGIVIVRWFE